MFFLLEKHVWLLGLGTKVEDKSLELLYMQQHNLRDTCPNRTRGSEVFGLGLRLSREESFQR